MLTSCCVGRFVATFDVFDVFAFSTAVLTVPNICRWRGNKGGGGQERVRIDRSRDTGAMKVSAHLSLSFFINITFRKMQWRALVPAGFSRNREVEIVDYRLGLVELLCRVGVLCYVVLFQYACRNAVSAAAAVVDQAHFAGFAPGTNMPSSRPRHRSQTSGRWRPIAKCRDSLHVTATIARTTGE